MGQPTTQDNQKVFNSSTQNLQSFMEQAGGPSNSKNMEAIYNNMAKLFDTFTNGALKEQGANAEILMRTIYRALDKDFLNIIQDSDAASKIADELKGKSGSKQPSSGSTSASKSNDQAASTAKQTKQETKEDLTQAINDFIAELQEAIMQVKMKLARQKDQQLSSQPQIPTQEPKKEDTGQTGQEQNGKEAQEEQGRISDAIETLKADDETETEEHLSKTEKLFQTFNGKDKDSDSGILGYLKNTMKQMSEDGELKQFFKNGNFNAKNLVETIKKTSAALLKGKTDLEKEQGKKRDAKAVEPKPMSNTVPDEHGQKAKPTELKDSKALNTLVKDSQAIAKQVQKNQKQAGMKQLLSGKINPKKEEQKQTVPGKQENTKLKPSPVKGMCVCPICGNSHCKGPSAHMSSGSKLQSKPNMQPLGKSGDKSQSSIDSNGVLSTLGKIHDNASKMIKKKKFRRNFSINYAGIQNQVKKNMKKVDKGENQVKKDLDKTEDGIGKLKRNQQGNLLSRLIFGGPIQTVLVTAAGAIILITLARAAWRSWKEQYMPQTDEKTYTLFGFTIPGVSQIKAFFKGIRNFVVVGLPIYYNKAKLFFGKLHKELFDKKKGLLRSSEVIFHNLIRIGLAWVIGQTKQIGGKALGWLIKFIAKAAKFVPGWGTAIGFLLDFAPQLYVFISTQLMNIWANKKDEALGAAQEMERKAKAKYKAPIKHLRRRLKLYTSKLHGFTTPGEFPALKTPHWDPSDIEQSRPKKMAIWVKPSRPKYLDHKEVTEQMKASSDEISKRTDFSQESIKLWDKWVKSGVASSIKYEMKEEDDPKNPGKKIRKLTYRPSNFLDGEALYFDPGGNDTLLMSLRNLDVVVNNIYREIHERYEKNSDFDSEYHTSAVYGSLGEFPYGPEAYKHQYRSAVQLGDSPYGVPVNLQTHIDKAKQKLLLYKSELQNARFGRFFGIKDIYDPYTREWNKELFIKPEDLATKLADTPFSEVGESNGYIGVPCVGLPFAWYPFNSDGKLVSDKPIFADPYMYEIQKAHSAIQFLDAVYNYFYNNYEPPVYIKHAIGSNDFTANGFKKHGAFPWAKRHQINVYNETDARSVWHGVKRMMQLWRAHSVPTDDLHLDVNAYSMYPFINEIETKARLGVLTKQNLSGADFRDLYEQHVNRPTIVNTYSSKMAQLAGIATPKSMGRTKVDTTYKDIENSGKFVLLSGEQFRKSVKTPEATRAHKKVKEAGVDQQITYNELVKHYYSEDIQEFFLNSRIEELEDTNQIASVPTWANSLLDYAAELHLLSDLNIYANDKIGRIAGLIDWFLSGGDWGWMLDFEDQVKPDGTPYTREEYLQEKFFNQWDTVNAFSYAVMDYFKFVVLPAWNKLESMTVKVALGQEDKGKLYDLSNELSEVFDDQPLREYMFMHLRPQAGQIEIVDYDNEDFPSYSEDIKLLDKYRKDSNFMTYDEKHKYIMGLKWESKSQSEFVKLLRKHQNIFKRAQEEAKYTGNYEFVNDLKDYYGYMMSDFNRKWKDHKVKFEKIPGLVDEEEVERISRPIETKWQRQARKDREQKKKSEERAAEAAEAKKKLEADRKRAEEVARAEAIIKEQEAIRKQEEKYESVLERLVSDPKSVTAKELEDFGEQVKNLKQEAENRINKLPRKDRDVRLSLLRGDTVSPQTFKEMKDTAIGLHGSLQAYVSEVNKIPVGSVLAIQNPGGGGGQTTVRQIDTDNVDMGD